MRLLSYAKTFDDRTITFDNDVDKVIEDYRSLADHQKQAATGMIVLRVSFKMLCELVDPLCKDSDLHLGRACVALMDCVFCNKILFFVFHLLIGGLLRR